MNINRHQFRPAFESFPSLDAVAALLGQRGCRPLRLWTVFDSFVVGGDPHPDDVEALNAVYRRISHVNTAVPVFCAVEEMSVLINRPVDQCASVRAYQLYDRSSDSVEDGEELSDGIYAICNFPVPGEIIWAEVGEYRFSNPELPCTSVTPDGKVVGAYRPLLAVFGANCPEEVDEVMEGLIYVHSPASRGERQLVRQAIDQRMDGYEVTGDDVGIVPSSQAGGT